MTKPRIALLIDADNVSAVEIDFAVNHASKRGDLLVRKAFGRLASIKSREAALTKHNCTAEITFQAQKNSADINLAIEAERLASQQTFDEIAILSHDRDFSTVALAIGRHGVKAVAYRRETIRNSEDKTFVSQAFLPDRAEYKRDLGGFKSFVESRLKKGGANDLSLSSLRTAAQKIFGKDLPADLGEKDFPSLLSKAGYKREIASGGIRDGRITKK